MIPDFRNHSLFAIIFAVLNHLINPIMELIPAQTAPERIRSERKSQDIQFIRSTRRLRYLLRRSKFNPE